MLGNKQKYERLMIAELGTQFVHVPYVSYYTFCCYFMLGNKQKYERLMIAELGTQFVHVPYVSPSSDGGRLTSG